MSTRSVERFARRHNLHGLTEQQKLQMYWEWQDRQSNTIIMVIQSILVFGLGFLIGYMVLLAQAAMHH